MRVLVKHEGSDYILWQERATTQPRALDLDAGRWLGFGRERKIRELIERHAANLGEVLTIDDAPDAKGGRPGRAHYLTREQVLYLAAKSETPRAVQVLQTMIAVFGKVLDGGALTCADCGKVCDTQAQLDNHRAHAHRPGVYATLEQVQERLGQLERRVADPVQGQLAALQVQMAELHAEVRKRLRPGPVQLPLQNPGPTPDSQAMLFADEVVKRWRERGWRGCPKSAEAFLHRLRRAKEGDWIYAVRELGQRHRRGRTPRWPERELEDLLTGRRTIY